MALQRGDVFVACFTQGREGNSISISPDKKIVVLERSAAGKIDQRSPYVCTVKAVGQAGADGTPRSYVAHIDHPLALRDYDTILDANFERGTLVLGLKFPTKFASLRRKEIQANAEEQHQARTKDQEESLVLTLRHDNLRRSISLSRDEAIRRGMRLNHFVRVPPPLGPIDPTLRHPSPRKAPDGWQPSVMDHTGYLLRPTRSLLESVPLVSVPEDQLLALARRRILEILSVRGYESLPLESPDHILLEQALTALARFAILSYGKPEARAHLAVAEARLAQRRAQHIPLPEIVGLLNISGLALRTEADDTASCAMLDFMTATPGRTSGSWAPCNLDVRSGRVHLAPDQVRVLLADRVQATAMADSPPAGAIATHLLAPLSAAVATALAERAASHTTQRFSGLVLEALPPCVSHALKAALRRGLFEAEAFNAGAVLCRTGLSSSKVNQALAGNARPTPGTLATPNGSNSRSPSALQPPSCRINKEIGICAWQCEGVRSPVEFYASRIPAKPGEVIH